MKNEHTQHSTDCEKIFEILKKSVVPYRACAVRTFKNACTARNSHLSSQATNSDVEKGERRSAQLVVFLHL